MSSFTFSDLTVRFEDWANRKKTDTATARTIKPHGQPGLAILILERQPRAKQEKKRAAPLASPKNKTRKRTTRKGTPLDSSKIPTRSSKNRHVAMQQQGSDKEEEATAGRDVVA